LGYKVVSVLGYKVVSVLGYKVVSVLGYKVVSVLGYKAVSVLGHKAVSVLGYKVVSVLGYKVVSVSGIQGCIRFGTMTTKMDTNRFLYIINYHHDMLTPCIQKRLHLQSKSENTLNQKSYTTLFTFSIKVLIKL